MGYPKNSIVIASTEKRKATVAKTMAAALNAQLEIIDRQRKAEVKAEDLGSYENEPLEMRRWTIANVLTNEIKEQNWSGGGGMDFALDLGQKGYLKKLERVPVPTTIVVEGQLGEDQEWFENLRDEMGSMIGQVRIEIKALS